MLQVFPFNAFPSACFPTLCLHSVLNTWNFASMTGEKLLPKCIFNLHFSYCEIGHLLKSFRAICISFPQFCICLESDVQCGEWHGQLLVVLVLGTYLASVSHPSSISVFLGIQGLPSFLLSPKIILHLESVKRLRAQ